MRPSANWPTGLPEVKDAYKDSSLTETWEDILLVRREVLKALEKARAEKLIGHPLDAGVNLFVNDRLASLLGPYAAELRTIFITSKAMVVHETERENNGTPTDMEGLAITVERVSYEKCDRCWIHDPTVGEDADQSTVCRRCLWALKEIDAT